MADRQQVMTNLRDTLQQLYPQRVVTRSYMDFARRSQEELTQGVYTLVSFDFNHFNNDQTGAARKAGRHAIKLLAQFKLDEPCTGEQIEDAEFVILQEVETFISAIAKPGNPYHGYLRLLKAQQSAQIDSPYGWVAFDLERISV